MAAQKPHDPRDVSGPEAGREGSRSQVSKRPGSGASGEFRLSLSALRGSPSQSGLLRPRRAAGNSHLPPRPVPVERRKAVRHPAKIPAYVEAQDDENQHLALVRNISETGALVLTHAVFEAGENVKMALYLSESGARTAAGEVMRSQRVIDDLSEIWPYEIALRFLQPIDFTDEIARLVEQQIKLGVIKR